MRVRGSEELRMRLAKASGSAAAGDKSGGEVVVRGEISRQIRKKCK